ncbi:MAG: zinc-binding dehydrogenase [Actinomycetota bacterium]|nr:zinc-binding dehydrogenase [Actinomycetota bacterium]
MRAVVIGPGGDLGWEERPDPEPGDTELVVAVEAAGLNAADLLQRRGLYPPPAGLPEDILGLELAGTVVGVGRQVTRFAAGDRVMAVVGGGGQATLAVVDESHALPVPESVSWPEAGGFPEVYSTAFDALFTQCGLGVGERVLVTGAAGGVGTAGVQLAAAAGARVTASVRDRGRHGDVAALGAEEVVVPDDVTAKGPYDVVLELVGAASLPGVLAALAPGGRVSVIGVGGGARVELDLLALMRSRARISGSTLRARDRQGKAAVAAAVAAGAVPLLAAGRIRVPVGDTFPMSEARTAYERFERGGKLGKIVLVPPDPSA